MVTPRRSHGNCLFLLVALLAPYLVFSASSSFQDEKNIYFPPFPSFGSPPIVPSPPIGVGPPPVGVGSPPLVYHSSPPPTHATDPSHGSGGSTPPAHRSPPAHGGGSGGGHHHHGGTPPVNCGNPTAPPRHVDPSPAPHPPSGHHNPSPAPPTGYHYYPPPSSGGSPTVPSTPPVILPPITPGIPFPSPPVDPNSPPIGGTCDFWRSHPGMIWGLFRWWGTTIGAAFGITSLPGPGAHLSLIEALSNTRNDGVGALYREGTASLLNSMVNKNFPFTTSHVKESFTAAVGSNKAAAAQARVFKLANEGHMKKLGV